MCGSASNSDYPGDIGTQCGAVRRQVAERVKALAGMEVPEVAVQVERLHSEHDRGAAQGRIAMSEPTRAPRARRRTRAGRARRSSASRGPRPPYKAAAHAGGRATAAGRFWSARRIPAASWRCCSSAAPGILLYDIAAVRADHPAMHWRRALARELAERPLDNIWVLVGAGVAAAARAVADRARRHARPPRRAADAPRPTPTYGPDCTATRPRWCCATGPWRWRACSRYGYGWGAPRPRCGPSRTSANSTTYAPTWMPCSATAVKGLGLHRPPGLSVHVARPGKKG